MARLYTENGDDKAAVTMYNVTLKKYKYSKKVWMAFQRYHLQRGQEAEALSLLQRSMQSLSRHKHIPMRLAYASAAFECNAFDRGRGIFEDMIHDYPRRTDLLHVYIDKEVKYNQINQARQLHERAVMAKMSVHNMKALLKKYLTFENTHGSTAGVEHVKHLAKEYVARLSAL